MRDHGNRIPISMAWNTRDKLYAYASAVSLLLDYCAACLDYFLGIGEGFFITPYGVLGI